MAIQFSCPSCRQPIEVDDDWANQEVSCPFCKKVVTAPEDTTLIAKAIPAARGVPEAEGFGRQAEPRVGGFGGGGAGDGAVVAPLRRWGFILMVTGWIFLGVVFFITAQKMVPLMQEALNDPNATPEKQQEAMMEVMEEFQKQSAGNPSLAMGMALGQGLAFLCLFGGLVLGILSISRGERPLGLQVVTIVFSTLPVLCLCLSAIAVMGMAGAG